MLNDLYGGALFRQNVGTGINNMDTLLPGPIWDSFSTLLYPRTLREALYWANWLKTRFGDYGSAIRRAVAYFMGGLDLVGETIDVESRDRYTKKLVDQHDILGKALEVGIDLQFNGNAFVSAFTPVTRVLVCPHCGLERYIENMERGRDYDFNGKTFSTTCPSCHKSETPRVKVYNASSDEQPLSMVNWSPLDISLDYCSITGAERITWTPGYNDKKFLENTADSAALQSLPETIFNAIVNDEAVLFKGEACLHLHRAADSLNRSLVNGWGLPSWLPGFRYVILLMLLERQLEAGAKDFILPLRLLFPLPQEKTGSDPIAGNQFSLKLANLRQQVEGALAAQSVKQASWHMVSTPIGSMQLGGDAKAIIPTDVLEYISNALLNTQCVPVEFHKASLQIGNASPPVSFKMFEQTWSFDARQHDRLINWYLRRCASMLGWPKMEGSLIKPSIGDDPMLIQVLAQAHSEGKISDTTFYRRFNIDVRMERKRIMEEAIEQYKDNIEMEKVQEQLGYSAQALGAAKQEMMNAGMGALQSEEEQAAAAEGGAPMEGQPMPAEGAVPAPQGETPGQTIGNMVSMQQQDVSIQQLQADAQQAAQLIITTPLGVERSRLYAQLREGNPTLHAMVKQLVENMEEQARQTGVEMQRQGQL